MNQPKSKQSNAKSNGRGGARPGAGRKKSAVTVRTREIAEKVLTETREGESPLEVMLSIMNDLRTAALVAKESEDADTRKASTKLLMLAANVAKDAAPYIHPRLAAIDHTTNGKDLAQMAGVLVVPGTQSDDEWERNNEG